MSTKADQDLSELNRTFRPALMAYFMRRLRNHAEAEDMTQDVFVRLAGSERGAMEAPDAYIFSIAANLLRDRARKAKVRFDHRGEMAADPDRGIDALDPARIVSGRQSLAALDAAILDLPEPTRNIYILHRLENMTRPAIASAFHMSEFAVDRQLAKATAFIVARLREVGA